MRKKTTKTNKLLAKEIYDFHPIRNVSTIFGTIFSNISVKIYNKDGTISDNRKQVPITYSPRQNYEIWMDQQIRNPNTNIDIGRIFPRISFEMTSMTPEFKRGSNSNLFMYKPDFKEDGSTQRVRVPIPYKFSYDLTLWSKSMDQMIEMIDQIIPIFAPELSIRANEVPIMGIINDLRITIGNITKSDNYSEGFTTNRIISWTISFDVLANIYQSRHLTELINTIYVDFVLQHTQTVQTFTEDDLNEGEIIVNESTE